MFTKAFWVDAVERAIKTAAQSVATVIVVGDVALDVFATDWRSALGVGLGGALLSILTSLGSGLKGGTPSLVEKGDPKG